MGERAQTACGEHQLIAIQTFEADEGPGFTGLNLNAVSNGLPTGDTDANDRVLQIFDVVTGKLINTGQAMIDCPFEACDPREPFKVSGSRVTFLTFEPDQGGNDLSGEGSVSDTVLQVFDICGERTTSIARVASVKGQNPLNIADRSQVFSAPAGRCSTGAACDPGNDTCGVEAFCQDDVCDTASGRCGKSYGVSCSTNAECQRCILRRQTDVGKAQSVNGGPDP